jgi:DNA repair protein RecN (Recombination protein N)
MAHVIARFTDLPTSTTKAVEDAGGSLEEGELLIQRQISTTGRSRCWVGGSSVTQSIASDIGADLVTIHGQSEQVRLSTPERQREVLDRAAGPDMASTLERYRVVFDQRKVLAQELNTLTQSARDRAREVDMLVYGLAEIEKVGPEEGEDEALQSEARRLQDADELRANAFTAMVALAGEDSQDSTPAITLLAAASKALAQISSKDSLAAPLADQALELSSLSTDLAGQVSSYLANLEADPVRLEWIESRLAQIKVLTRKYGENASQVRQWALTAHTRLQELEGSDERISLVTQHLESLEAELGELAIQITRMRREAARQFGAQIGAELAALAMPHAQVEFRVTPLPELGPWGKDSVALFFTANPGSDPGPLSKVASGGELSRVRLAIEVVLADSALKQTFVFDEVDAGIGGAVGLQVGQRLAKLATQGQVIVVTHLAQVAAFADTHYVITKADNGEVTASSLRHLHGDQRLWELARMMGGLDQSVSSQAHAGELMDQARAMKNL